MNQQIILNYNKALQLYHDKIVVSSIHNDEDLCFNTMIREYIYAIKTCFKENNIMHISTKECIFGLNLVIPFKYAPLIPPFSRFIYHYKFGFHKRLIMLEQYFEKNQEDYTSLFQTRVNLDKNFIIVRHLPLPPEIKSIISTFVYVDLKQYDVIRNKYQELRYKIKNK